MSLLVEGMAMPKSCAECRINCDMLMTGYLNGFAEGAVKRHECCPLVEVPPHGDLIDQDACRDEFANAVYEALEGDETNDRANIIIDEFDLLLFLSKRRRAKNEML